MAVFEVGEGKIEGSRWRGSHQMMTNGLISTVRNEQMFIEEIGPCRAMMVRVKIAMDTYVVLSQQARAELQIIIQIKRATSLEAHPECQVGWILRQLLHASDTSKLSM